MSGWRRFFLVTPDHPVLTVVELVPERGVEPEEGSGRGRGLTALFVGTHRFAEQRLGVEGVFVAAGLPVSGRVGTAWRQDAAMSRGPAAIREKPLDGDEPWTWPRDETSP